LTRSRAITRTILGTFSGACPVFGTVTFAFSLAGTAAVALPGAAAFATSPTTSATPTIPTAAGQKDIHVVVGEISGHTVCGLGSEGKPAAGITRAGIRACGCSPGDEGHAQSHAKHFYPSGTLSRIFGYPFHY
jgi:hypothetical protein